MFYKPSEENGQNTQGRMEVMNKDDEQQDSGVELLDFPHQSSLDALQGMSLTLGSISEDEEGVQGEQMESDGIDCINGNLARLCLQQELPSGTESESLKQSQNATDQDSGLYDSIPNTNESEASSQGDVNTESCDVMSAHHWMLFLSDRCVRNGEIIMDQVVRLFQGNQDGDNLLNLFIIHNLREPAMFLIDHAPAPDWLDLHNTLRQTPLHLAVMTRQPDIVQHLISAGASVAEIDSMGNTPLHWACAIGCEVSARLLLEPERDYGVRGNVFHPIVEVPTPKLCVHRNCEGDTCLHLAAKGEHLTIVQMLLDHGCDPNVGDGKSGRTVLHHAAQAGHVELTSLLLAERRTKCDFEDYGRHTPHDLARGHERSRTMRLLISHGAKATTTWGRRSSDTDPEDSDDEFGSEMILQNGHCSG